MRSREYSPADERGWLECRLLGFFDSDYYDDVQRARPVLATRPASVAGPGLPISATPATTKLSTSCKEAVPRCAGPRTAC